LETIIEAIAQLDATSRPLLALCGPVRDSGYYTRLRERALELNVAGDVRHLGFVPDEDLADLYRSAIVCVAASRDEGFNLLPLEALACDAIVICSDIPVHRELYGDFATFFPPESPDLLAGAIRDLQTLRERHRAGAETRETVLDRFSWEAMAQRMASAFDELAPDGAAARGPGHSSGS
jgi:glycosyltransferase involved in cell wall biosynthesis